MSEWRELPLGEVATLQRGFDLPERNRKPGNVPVVSSSGISGTHNVVKVRGPGVVTGRYGTLGRVFYIEQDFWPHNTTLFVKDFHGNEPRFVYYLLSGLNLAQQSAVSAVPGINRNDLHRIPVLLPPLPVQRRIAQILGRLDDKIEVNRRINRTLEAMARALYRHWFVDFRPFQDGEFVESELGLIPKGWEVSTIGAECQVVSGGTPSTKVPEYWEEGDILWATPTDMTSLKAPVIFDTTRKITQSGLENSSAKMLPPGSVLMSSRATLGVAAINYAPISTNQGFKSMIPGPRVNAPYLLLYIQHNQNEILNRASGTTFMEINTRNFKALKILIPPSEVMRAFDAIVGKYYDQIYAHERENVHLSATRDYLLPRLLSGEVNMI